jgi:integrase
MPRDEILQRLDRLSTAFTPGDGPGRHVRAVTVLLDWLEAQPGATWQERWIASGADAAGAGWSRAFIGAMLPAAASPARNQWVASLGIGQLLVARVIRPGYPWLYSSQPGKAWAHARELFDPDGFARLAAHCQATGRTILRDQAVAFTQLTRILLHNGGTLSDITVADCLEADAAIRAARRSNRGASLYYDLLLGAGFLPAGSPPDLRAAKQRPLTIEELVDGYGIECRPVRDLIVDYLRERQGALDYTTLRQYVRNLVLIFWRDLELHHPGIDSLHLTPQMAAAWKERLKVIRHGRKSIGAPRADTSAVTLTVRAFYSDIAHWALEDPARWGPWAAPNPIRPADTAIRAKNARRTTARMHQRTRDLAPILPRLVDTVTQRKHAAGRRLAAARSAGHGELFEAEGEQLIRHLALSGTRADPGQGSPRVYARDPQTGNQRDLTYEEDDAFWAWAIVEILRHTGIRAEELLELTHHSFTSYRLPATREIVPLLQIAPSKTDTERLLVVSPELADVLTAVIFRVRGDREAVPLTPRYDPRERLTSPAMPHLMQRNRGPYHRVISGGHVQHILNRAVAASGLRDASQNPVHYTPHDFRRIFATEGAAAGLPLPILAKLMGHATITTTQGYAAIYPQDVIEHHRAFISRRRALRPSAEYRQPTDEEWEEFLGHFERRKVELGVCARAYGSPCQHEHACVRCPLLRAEPKQMPRLLEIIDNLQARLDEAHTQGWLGEVEGIQVSLEGARQKLNQMKEAQARPVISLGLPAIRTP